MKKRILIACEFSGIVRDAFASVGWEAWSCDILPSERPGNHIIADVKTVLTDNWDMMIAHPPCTYLARSGARWKSAERDAAAQLAYEFVVMLWGAPIEHIAIENPYGKLWNLWRKPDQIIQPWQFGEYATKATCLWLKNVPPLLGTFIISDPMVNWTEKQHRSAKDRARTFPGIAAAMARQWQNL